MRELEFSNTVGDVIYYLIDKKYCRESPDNENNFNRKYFTKKKLLGDGAGAEN